MREVEPVQQFTVNKRKSDDFQVLAIENPTVITYNISDTS